MLAIASSHLIPDMPARSVLLHPVAASGGVLVRLDRPALTPALTEIRLLATARLASLCHCVAPSGNSRLGLVVAV